MPGVFRRRWFPRARKAQLPIGNATESLIGIVATASIGAFVEFDKTITSPSVGATASVGSFSYTTSNSPTLSGVSATSAASSPHILISAALAGIHVTASSGTTLSTAEGPRDFWIAGIEQLAIPPGIVMYPTSEDLSTVVANGNTYVLGSSQFYTVGEVHWNGQKRVVGVDWQLVSPFTHIVDILHPIGIIGPVTVVYYRWNIGVRAGFKVNAYPVSFAFNGTSIIAEQIPPLNQFFTVEFTSARAGNNPMSLFARYPTLVDDVLTDHTLYDGANGFQTDRPIGYVVYDTGDNQLWQWSGTAWVSIGMIAPNGTFYAKRQRTIYKFDGAALQVLYVAGDGLNMAFVEVLEYPLYGEGIGKNLLSDAFAGNASIDHPAAFVVSQRPGQYDSWIPI